MFPWQDIMLLIVRGAISVLFEPMFWLILAMVGFQYWQLQRTQLRLFGVYGYSLRQQIVLAAVYGAVGGVLGSFLLTLVGVTLNQLGLNYIWPLAIALAMINMRFLCFAYAGGLVALANVLFGWPQVNVPQVLALVAVLHITESVLIFISSRYSAVPLIIRRDDGRLVGAFNLQNFWPLPLVLLAAVAVPGGDLPGGVIKMPDWWPLLPLGVEPPEGHRWVYAMMPVVAALGYADVAVSNPPARRRRLSAFHLALYSVGLLGLALLSAKFAWLQPVAAIASPAGHELLIQLDNRRELSGRPRYVPPEYGVMVLDTVLDTPARKIGLRPGDILLSLAGLPVNSGYELAYAINAAPPEFELEFYRDGRTMRRLARFFPGERRLGVILVPEGYEQQYVVMTTDRYGLWDWLKRKVGR
ncbi:trypsin-like serine protease, typically periplasmic, contain C-terminal PDZ domain [Thermosinus carboxydivorans Nor1]|uniref:Trypsin-like serine protease, typically periplasmic, contain C-terminal PDZ domain n=1 Tax=Thermosinus carboxydivorans Nor1 TaxID=401526 RepID=A1HSZ7_9FIRM|nr:PDZ domain-containing protein [Thermosinus carboxydivorans]EAX46852.1 trypsin-like serine protease, typically periplasmic, contain C-terminal PDZ domain [Thermosinus carboxydivorans Nor1]